MIVFRFYFESFGFRWQDLLAHIFFLKRLLNVRFPFVLDDVILGNILCAVMSHADDFWHHRFLVSPTILKIFLFSSFIRPIVSLIDIFLI